MPRSLRSRFMSAPGEADRPRRTAIGGFSISFLNGYYQETFFVPSNNFSPEFAAATNTRGDGARGAGLPFGAGCTLPSGSRIRSPPLPALLPPILFRLPPRGDCQGRARPRHDLHGSPRRRSPPSLGPHLRS